MNDLKPCPFCGSDDLEVDRDMQFVGCTPCGATGPVDIGVVDCEDAWNTRAISPDVAALRAALERLVEAIPEYAYDGDFDQYFCQSCGRIKGNGHARGCKRGAALAAARAALEGTR